MDTSVLLLNTSAGQLLIDVHTIVRIEASSNYSKLFFSNGKMLVCTKLLKWFEEKLPLQFFVRMHRSHLVNNRYLKSRQMVREGFVLQTGEWIQLSRRRKKNIINQLITA
jgi:DNA-binding LytR/AlgR family response regulator